LAKRRIKLCNLGFNVVKDRKRTFNMVTKMREFRLQRRLFCKSLRIC